MKKYKRIKEYIFLHISLFIYSLCSVLSKLATRYEIFSLKFILFYILNILVLIIYAVLWQQNLKKFSLTTAFANKSIVVIWGMIWGNIIFSEKINFNMIIGSVIIFVGIKMVISNE